MAVLAYLVAWGHRACIPSYSSGPLIFRDSRQCVQAPATRKTLSGNLNPKHQNFQETYTLNPVSINLEPEHYTFQ